MNSEPDGPTPGAASLIQEIKQTLRWLAIATICLAVVLIATVGYVAWQGDKTHDSLCALKGDLERRVDQSQRFLDNPEIFPQFNDPKTLALIKQQIDNQRATIASLDELNC